MAAQKFSCNGHAHAKLTASFFYQQVVPQTRFICSPWQCDLSVTVPLTQMYLRSCLIHFLLLPIHGSGHLPYLLLTSHCSDEQIWNSFC